MQKGFTLMELLGVIVILSLLLLLLVPNILEQLNNKKGEISAVQEEEIKKAADLYIDEHPNHFDVGGEYCICLSTLENTGYLSESFINNITGEDFSEKSGVNVIIKQNGNNKLTIGECRTCDETTPTIVKKTVTIKYIKGSNVTSIGKTSDSCTIQGDKQSCSITLPSITAKEGYKVIGWSATKNASNGLPSGTVVNVKNNGTYYAIAEDDTNPTVTLNPNSGTTYSNGKAVTVTLADSGSGLLANQNVYYAWSTSSSTVPNFTSYVQSTNQTGSKSTTVTIPNSVSNKLTGSYYLWIKGGISDVAGNISEDEVSGVFKFDAQGINLSISSSSTTKTITIAANASSVSKIVKYEYSIDNGATWKTGTSNTYTFTGLTQNKRYNIAVRVTSEAGFTKTASSTATTKSIPIPTFKESETSSGKNVTITYPSGCGSTYTCSYQKDGGSWTTVTSTTKSVSFTKSGTLIAKVSDGTNEVSNVYNVSIQAILRSWSADATTDFHNSTYRSKIISVDVVDYKNVPSNAVASWDVSNNNSGDIMAWVVASGSNYKLYIGADGYVIANEDSSNIFNNFTALKTVNLTKLDTSNATNMSSMFSNCSSIVSLDLTSFDTRNVTDMSNMFELCKNLTGLNISSFITSKVTDMQFMFHSCIKLKALNLSNFNTSNVINLNGMFNNCQTITTINLSSFDTRNVTDMSYLFGCCYALATLNISNFNTSMVTDMSSMFNGIAVRSLDLRHFDTSKVTNMSNMFGSCKNLTSLNVSSFNTSKVINMANMFNAVGLSSLDIRNFDTSKVKLMYSMFESSTKLRTIYVGSKWTTANATTTNMFVGCGTSSVTRK